MESAKINHLKQIGDCVKRERNKRKMNQLEFYRFLYPGSNLANEGIKSYMNDIENAKRKKIDPDFLLELHEKCDLGMDYIFGYETEFPNHESENASNYTGLSVETIELLHKLALAKKAEIPSLEPGMNDEDSKDTLTTLKKDKDFIKPSTKVNLEFELVEVENGMKGIIIRDPFAQFVHAQFQVENGFLSDTIGGLAHLDEHMIFDGSEKYPYYSFDRKFWGTSQFSTNAYTDSMSQVYYVSTNNFF